MLIARLLNEHSKLRSLGAEMATLVANAEPCDLAELARCRWNVARSLHLHLAYEERHLFSRYETDPRPEVRLASAKARRRVDQLHALYKVHVERWNGKAIAAGWPHYQLAIRSMIARFIAMMDQEEAELFPLVAEDGESYLSWRPGMKNWAGEAVALQPHITGAAAAAWEQNSPRTAFSKHPSA